MSAIATSPQAGSHADSSKPGAPGAPSAHLATGPTSARASARGRTVLILSQVFPPDPASVGQHMADVAEDLVRRGYHVRVITANRGYDDPTQKFKPREVVRGADVRRVPLSSFGKANLAIRALAMFLFMFQCLWACLFTPKLACILVSTSPPMCGFAAGVACAIRRVPLKYWVMDLNPDQMIELGKMKPDALAAKVLNALQRFVIGRSQHIVALDRFMVDRLNKKRDTSGKLTIMPPWPHEEVLELVEHESNWFRDKHNLQGKFVVMYSGNHGYSTPITTVLKAALAMEKTDPNIVFMFIGGGVGKKEVDKAVAEHKPANVIALPYQPFKDLRYSLSAADVHVVTVGPDVVGVVHPCKIYGAMAVARPILLVAPDPCHASDIVRDNRCGWHIPHGDIDGAMRTIRGIASTDPATLKEMGLRGKQFIDRDMSKDALCARFCDIVEQGVQVDRAARRASSTGA